jgi:peptide/nickel transport system permease protein
VGNGDAARRGSNAALAVLGVATGLTLLTPLVVNDRPIAARDPGGRLVFPFLEREDRPGAPSYERVLVWAPIRQSWREVDLTSTLEAPSVRHPFGTDGLGRDLLARVLSGARVSFTVGFGATALALLFGVLLGGTAGLYGGRIDLVLARVIETLSCFPPFILALALQAVGGGGVGGMVLAIALGRTAAAARFARSESIRWRGTGVWTAARASGNSRPAAALRHLLPLASGPLAVQAAFGVAHAILLESTLSFLGLGVPAPTPSWGAILAEGRGSLGVAWWPVLFPCLGLALTLAALSWAGDRLASDDPL